LLFRLLLRPPSSTLFPYTSLFRSAMTQKLADAASVEAAAGAAPYLAVDAADALILGAGNVPSELALDPTFAVTFAQQRDADGRKIYPGLSYGTDRKITRLNSTHDSNSY